ncbi:beta-galactosidase [Streptomyces sp. NPDC016469]|uniref:beta-galactosidase n=1 Tax=Streptomyces sp. NPDC016469 TaxID=3157191 RepID=UPI0033E84BC0
MLLRGQRHGVPRLAPRPPHHPGRAQRSLGHRLLEPARYGDWEEIDLPRDTTAFKNPGQDLDYRGFSSGALVDRYRAEAAPDTPVTTNLLGTLEKKADAHALAAACDIVSLDHYLPAHDVNGHIDLALNADLARGAAGGHPWLLMEHSTSAVNWQPVNVAKQPGEMRRNSLGHPARGADAIMFFQWRQSRAGAEKWHSAMLPHGGTDTRVRREAAALDAELHALREVAGSRVEADVAGLLDWHNWWALEAEARPSDRMRYLDLVRDWYEALWRLNITCDIVPPGTPLASYKALFAPNLYLLGDEDAAALSRYVHTGGHLAVGCFSGVVDGQDRVHPGDYLGALHTVLGLRIDEYLPLRDGVTVDLSDASTATHWAERVEPAGCETLVPSADGPEGGPAPGGPAVTRHRHGSGPSRYVATRASAATLRELLRGLARDAGLRPAAETPEDVEAVRRSGRDGSWLFLLNHGTAPVEVHTESGGVVAIPAGGAATLREPGRGSGGPGPVLPTRSPAEDASRR